ncbi:MAG: hypothetical protein HZA90_11795 [Verrucomicrobia bacterium]|nr:hypothetical protein [Verrucomicrobiota bacterium]
MTTKRHRLTVALLLGALAATLTGCIWFRLLALKNQLAEFDRYVKVDESRGLALQFVKPVVRDSDVREFLEVDPTCKSTNGTQQTWSWTFEKVPNATNAEPNQFNLTFETSFENGKLNRFAIPDRFLAIVPKWFVLGVFRSLGNAKIDKSKRSAQASLTLDPKEAIRPLTKTEVTQLLGQPFEITESKQGFVWRYRHRLRSPSIPAGQHLEAVTKITVAKDSEKLKAMQLNYTGHRLTLSFDEPEAKPKK